MYEMVQYETLLNSKLIDILSEYISSNISDINCLTIF